MRTGPRLEPRYKEVLRQNVLAIPRFVISRLFSIYFTITGVRKIVRYTQDFVISRFVTSRFHSIL